MVIPKWFILVMIRRWSMRTSKVLSVSLPAEMLSRVETLARAKDRIVSELVREAIRTYESLRAGTLKLRRAAAKATLNEPA
jgi:metal-responsive CopG/Arc/MetJ family transcriptional regulator